MVPPSGGSPVRWFQNYLTEDELKAEPDRVVVPRLRRVAGAQSQADAHGRLDRQADDFIRLNDRDILNHAGKISHDTARLKVEAEYDTFRATQAALTQPVDQHFLDAIDELKKIECEVKKTPKSLKRRKEKGE